MTNYIKADIRRILHKNTFLIAVGIFLALYAGMVFIYFNPSFTADMYVAKITSYLSYFPLIVGLFVFMSVYADDFKCKSMQVAISAIAIFASQNAVNGIIFYVLFSTKSVYIILSMILGQNIIVNTIGDLTKYLYTPQLYAARTVIIQHGSVGAAPIVAIVVYVLLPAVISAIIFRKKELEF